MPRIAHEIGANTHKVGPWDHPGADGSELNVDEFLTVMFSRVARKLRRQITVPYAEKYQLSVPEWRILALLGECESLSFADLVVRSSCDKAQVSRSLKQLVERQLIWQEALGSNPRQGVLCHMTAQGLALYAQVMPEARRQQSQVLQTMSSEERNTLYELLQRLLSNQPDNAADSSTASYE